MNGGPSGHTGNHPGDYPAGGIRPVVAWEVESVGEPNPYQRWSGAPKHWAELPEQRSAAASAPATRIAAVLRRHRNAVVTVLALGVTILLILLVGLGASEAKLDAPGPEPASLR